MPTMILTRLKAARKKLGVTQTELSEDLRLARGLGGEWERGSREPSLEKFRGLVVYLQCSADWLLGLEAPEQDRGRGARQSREEVLSDYQCAIGLRELAEDGDLVRALRVKPREWEAMHRLNEDLSKAGYMALLGLLRTG